MFQHHLVDNLLSEDVSEEPIRAGFGRGLLEAGKRHINVVAACADLTDSTKMGQFAEAYPERFIEIGVAEQNLVTVGTGMAAMGKVPFVSSYAAFSPGRNWEQIRTTICLNNRPVKIIGSHAGVSVGPDGATHQMLEDLTLMRALPNMIVIAPCDSVEAEKATLAMAVDPHPNYMRLAREGTPVITTAATPFSIDKAVVFKVGHDITLIGTGTMTYHVLVAAARLAEQGIDAEVVHVPVLKPLDHETIIGSLSKTGGCVTAEEGQINGGLGGAVAEIAGELCPVPLKRIGMQDRFGESGEPAQLLTYFGLDADHIVAAAREIIDRKEK
jgi:transketolase